MGNEFQTFTLQSLKDLQSDVVEVKTHLSEVKADLRHIDKILEHNSTILENNTKDVQYHIHRTDLIENQMITFNSTVDSVGNVLKDIGDRLKPIENDMLFRRWLRTSFVFIGGGVFSIGLAYIREIVSFLIRVF